MENLKITGNLEVGGQISGIGVRNLINTIYPVGISLEFKLDVNPNTLWPWQTWEEWGQGCVVIGAGTHSDGTTEKTFSLGASNGEYNHTLTNSEMPAHGHSFSGSSHSGNIPEVVGGGGTGHFDKGIFHYDSSNGKVSGGGSYRHLNLSISFTTSGTVGTAGNGISHNNIQPYVVCKRWTRTN